MESVQLSVRDLKLKHTWVLQQDIESKHQQVHLWMAYENQNENFDLWPSQSLDLNPTEMLWHDLKNAVNAQKPSKVAVWP